MNVTWYEKGIEKGIERERRERLRDILELRFGSLPSEVLARLEQVPVDRLKPLLDLARRAQALNELPLEN